MRTALDLAGKAEGKTYPNPMVGAVIVKNGKIEGKGYHAKAGMPHAEVNAIKNAGKRCSGSEMFVTLEPCSTFGKTGPCTDAIIKSGIKKVYIAMKDPNLINHGKGVRCLKKAGILVEVGLYKKEAKDLNKKYVNYIVTGEPYLTIKLAQSIDGKISAADGTSKWISSASSRGYVKQIRGKYDAIMVGANTVRKDDPMLLSNGAARVARIVLDTRLSIDVRSNLVQTSGKSPVIICTTELADEKKIFKLKKNGIDVIILKSKSGRVPVKKALKKIAEKGFINIFVEGGGELIGSLIDESLVDEVMFFIAPILLGGSFSSIKGKGVSTIKRAVKLHGITVTSLSRDMLVTAYVKK